MHRSSGLAIEGNEHLIQSIGDILSTPLGSRVMRRDYGSILFDLIDQPINAATTMLLRAATAIAILNFEPRVRRIKKIFIGGDFNAGQLEAEIELERNDLPPANSHVLLSIPIRRGGAVTSSS